MPPMIFLLFYNIMLGAFVIFLNKTLFFRCLLPCLSGPLSLPTLPVPGPSICSSSPSLSTSRRFSTWALPKAPPWPPCPISSWPLLSRWEANWPTTCVVTKFSAQRQLGKSSTAADSAARPYFWSLSAWPVTSWPPLLRWSLLLAALDSPSLDSMWTTWILPPATPLSWWVSATVLELSQVKNWFILLI